jgi:hypothetical protein
LLGPLPIFKKTPQISLMARIVAVPIRVIRVIRGSPFLLQQPIAAGTTASV